MGQIAHGFKSEMSMALYNSYLRILESGECASQAEAVNLARKSEAPHFFSSAKSCMEIISKMLKRQPTGLRAPEKIKKYQMIFKRLAIYIYENPEKASTMSLFQLCETVISQPAPEYYVCFNTAKQVILKERARRREEAARRWVR